MDEERMAILELADELQVRKQRIFKLLSGLGIRASQRRDPARGNQNVATASLADASAIRREFARSGDSEAGVAFSLGSDEVGVFYLIQLEPEHDPGRFKVGFTVEMEGCLQKHRCSAPSARVVQTWPCRRTWERAAVDCATDGCERLRTEVFRTEVLQRVTESGQRFVDVMPRLAASDEDADREMDEIPDAPA
jgi:hypothetical protein